MYMKSKRYYPHCCFILEKPLLFVFQNRPTETYEVSNSSRTTGFMETTQNSKEMFISSKERNSWVWITVLLGALAMICAPGIVYCHKIKST